jgi:uncharacterized protein (TIGR01370 family)
LARYNIIVLDPAFEGSVEDCEAGGAKTFAYISLGEFATTQNIVSLPSDPAVLLDENPNWPGTFNVDVRRPEWRSHILDEVVPRLLALGFAGLFLDTLDTPPHLEEIDPIRFRGMHAAAAALVHALRRRVPDAPIIMNRGYALLAEVADAIDGVVAESFLTTYDFATKSYKWVEPALVVRQHELLRPARERRRPIPILSLDYWARQDEDTIRKIYNYERTLGHLPYVAPILLDQVVEEPRE